MKTYRIVLFFIIIFGISYVIYDFTKARESVNIQTDVVTQAIKENQKDIDLYNERAKKSQTKIDSLIHSKK